MGREAGGVRPGGRASERTTRSGLVGVPSLPTARRGEARWRTARLEPSSRRSACNAGPRAIVVRLLLLLLFLLL